MQKEDSFTIGRSRHCAASCNGPIVVLERASYEFRAILHATVEKCDGTNCVSERKKLLCGGEQNILIVLDVQFEADGHRHDLATNNPVEQQRMHGIVTCSCSVVCYIQWNARGLNQLD